MAVEHLLAGETDLHRTACHHRELGDDDLVVERVTLAAEPTSVGAGDDADARGRQLQHLGDRAVHVVRRLGGAPQRELAVRRPIGERRVLLHREMGVALVEEEVFPHMIRLGKAALHVAELEIDGLVQVPFGAVVVDPWLRRGQSLLRRRDGSEFLVLHVYEVERDRRDLFAHRRDRRHGVADEPSPVRRQRVLVLAHGQDSEWRRKIPSREHRLHAL